MKRASGFFEGRRFRNLMLMASVIAVGVAVQSWAVSQWPENFDSDEAIFGLMARHALHGEFISTVYGTEHLGSLESYIAAGFFAVFGPSVTTLRIGSILLFSIFLSLQAIYVTRTFGFPTAIVSLLYLALPGFRFLSWTYKPIGAYGILLVLGTGILVLAQVRHSKQTSQRLAAGALGILLGLGFWSNQMIVAYAAALGMVAFLASPEWAALHARLERLSRQFVQIPFREALPVAVIGTAGVGVLAFFSSGCQPVWQFEKVQAIARAVLMALSLATGVAAVLLSRRRLHVSLNLGALTLGFGLGYAPLLYDWLAKENPPVSVIRKSCPTNVVSHIELLVKEILPSLWGVPPLGEIALMPVLMILTWGAIIGLVCIAIIAFMWRHRIRLWKLVAFSPLDGSSRPYLVVALLLGLPITLSILSDNTIDADSVRHLLVTAQASSIVFALFVTELSKRSPKVGLPILVFWTAFVGLTNINYAREHWPVKFTRFDPERVAILETYLQDKGATTGFADYWGAYALDFVTSERLTLAPYNGLNRYPPYSNTVAASSVRAFIFPLSNAPGSMSRPDDLIAFLQEENLQSGEKGAFPWITEMIRSLTLQDRRRVADWDVWIMAEK